MLVRTIKCNKFRKYKSKGMLQYWPAPPDDPQGIRVASVIEFSVCLFVLSKFSNFFLQYKAAAVHAVIYIRYGSKEVVQGSLLVHQYIVP